MIYDTNNYIIYSEFEEQQIINKDNANIELNNNIREELLKKKSYYKLLKSDCEEFLKKINYEFINENSIYDTTTISRKTNDKSINYNFKDTRKNLYKNISYIKKNLYQINNNFNQHILVLDGENILKFYKYQQLIKLHLTNEEYNDYFKYWNFGLENTFQPLTSLNLTIKIKIYLIEILVKNYLNEYNCLILLSGKNSTDINQSVYINNFKSIVFPIIYNKCDIREQDDHLLLFLFYHFDKIKITKIISGDKFKWFNIDKNYKNFIICYNFDEKKIILDISDAYTNDIIIYSDIKYQLGYFSFPFIKNIDGIIQIMEKIKNDNNILFEYEKNILFEHEKNILFEHKKNILFEHEQNILFEYEKNIYNQDYNFLINFLIALLLNLIKSNYENDKNKIKSYNDLNISIIKQIIHYGKKKLDEIECILNRLNTINKKIFEQIEKYNINIFFKIIFQFYNFNLDLSPSLIIEDIDTEQLDKFNNLIKYYIIATEIYLIFKSMSFLIDNYKFVIKLSKFYCQIIKIYDVVESSIYKIRKISNYNSFFNKSFSVVLSHHMFMKKNGFCKKDY